MKSTPTIICPVCAMRNDDQQRCSFCGTSLKAVAPEPPVAAKRAATGTTTTFHPPAPSEPRQPGLSLSPKYAGFWIRAVAFAVDSFILRIIIWLLVGIGVFGYLSGSGQDISGDQFLRLFALPWGYLAGVDLLVTLSYFTFFLGRTGQTPGKMLFGLKVLRKDGTEIDYAQAMIRTMGYYLNHLTLGIGFLWIAVDPRKQGFHDKIAGAVEIRLGLAEIRDWQPPMPTSS